jgi:hypothetical protein
MLKVAPSKIGTLRDLLFALLQEHERDGALPTSARFLYYELVQRGQLSKERTGARRPADDVGYLGDLDLSGGHIEDNTGRVLEREVGGGLRWERIALTASNDDEDIEQVEANGRSNE